MKYSIFKSFKLSGAFHIETSHLICSRNRMSGFDLCFSTLGWIHFYLLAEFLSVEWKMRCTIFEISFELLDVKTLEWNYIFSLFYVSHHFVCNLLKIILVLAAVVVVVVLSCENARLIYSFVWRLGKFNFIESSVR